MHVLTGLRAGARRGSARSGMPTRLRKGERPVGIHPSRFSSRPQLVGRHAWPPHVPFAPTPRAAPASAPGSAETLSGLVDVQPVGAEGREGT
jgi:hypothetical protein